MLSSVSFGDPVNYFAVKGGALNKSRSIVTAAVSRILEKDVTISGVTSRRSMSVQSIIQIPPVGFLSSEVDSLLSDIDSFVTGTVLDRLLNGES